MYITEYDQKTLYKSIFVLFIHWSMYLFIFEKQCACRDICYLSERGKGSHGSPLPEKKTFLSKWGKLPQFEEYMFSVVDSIQK